MSEGLNTANKAWLVVRQFHKQGERFVEEKEAMAYAAILAQKLPGERLEIFQCVRNVRASMPVIVED